MRISFNRNSALAKARHLANNSTEKNKNTTVRTNYSNKSSLISSLNSKRTSTGKYKKNNTTTSAQTKNDYTEIKNVADSLQMHVKKLLETGDDSLFAQATTDEKQSENSSSKNKTTKQDTSKDKHTETELAANKEKVVKEINSFIEDYNILVKKLNSIGGTINNLYVNHMKKYATQEHSALKKLGITQASNGTLSVNQDTLKSADIENMKIVFGTKGGFVDKVGERSKSVEANAKSEIVTLNKKSYTTSSNYNRYGNSYANYESSGSQYQKRG